MSMDAQDQEDQFRGTSELINGIEVQHHAAMSPSGLAGQTSKKSKHASRFKASAEETKANFYDPNNEHNVEVAANLYDTNEAAEENAILEARIDPLEWKQELDRVYKELTNVEKEVEIAKREGGDASSADYEEYRRHLELVLELCKEIKESSTHEVRRVFADSADALDSDLSFIRRNEIRINKMNQAAITQLGQIT